MHAQTVAHRCSRRVDFKRISGIPAHLALKSLMDSIDLDTFLQTYYTHTHTLTHTHTCYYTDTSCVDNVDNFVKESILMLGFDHPNVLKLLGVCFDTKDHLPLIVLPFMANGDLRSFLMSKRGASVTARITDFPEVVYFPTIPLPCITASREFYVVWYGVYYRFVWDNITRAIVLWPHMCMCCNEYCRNATLNPSLPPLLL